MSFEESRQFPARIDSEFRICRTRSLSPVGSRKEVVAHSNDDQKVKYYSLDVSESNAAHDNWLKVTWFEPTVDPRLPVPLINSPSDSPDHPSMIALWQTVQIDRDVNVSALKRKLTDEDTPMEVDCPIEYKRSK